MTPLDRAYRDTTYRVFPDGELPIDLRIGKRSPRLDALLAQRGVREWAFITAWNPGSRPLADAANRARQEELLSALRERHLDWLAASGVPADAQWEPEDSVLVFGITRDDALALANRFGQAAIVAGSMGGEVELAYCHRGNHG